jgi:hypothetical protein
MGILFDRIIELEFWNKGKAVMLDSISYESTGPKPEISIMGKHVTTDVVAGEMQIRITNFYPAKSLDEYGIIVIKSRYNYSAEVDIIEGEVKLAFLEKPGPDGVTMFSLLPCILTDYARSTFTRTFRKDTTLRTMLDVMADKLTSRSGNKWSVEYSLDDTYTLPINLTLNGSFSDAMQTLKKMFGFTFRLSGTVIAVYDAIPGRSSAAEFSIDFFSQTPIGTAGSITFTTPWIPGLQCGHRARINPKWLKQNYGYENIGLPDVLTIQYIDFSFSTGAQASSMTVMALNTVRSTD